MPRLQPCVPRLQPRVPRLQPRVPQVANFIYSVPQLFRLVPCPRHRMPGYDAESDRLVPSYVEFELAPRLGERRPPW